MKVTADDALPLAVELLGPVRAWRAGTEIDIGAARRRAVFAMLAVRAGQAVSRDELIDGVWGASPPPTAGGVLYTYVSGLRRAFEPRRARRSTAEVIVSAGGGYALRIDHAGLDVHRFEQHRVRAQALADTDSAGAIAELGQALALWRGAALSDVPGPFAEAQRARLAELRLATVELRAELALAAGRHAEVVAGLSELIAEHPVREQLRALLVIALHRTGRRGEALEVYRDGHRVLVDELGIEPGPALRLAHREVLGARESVVLPAHPQPAPTAIDIVGREHELDLLRRAVAEVAAGRKPVPATQRETTADEAAGLGQDARQGGEPVPQRGAIADEPTGAARSVWLDGEPGVGKSALLAAGLAGAVDAGCRVAWATADELGGRFPLRVVLDCLEVTASSPDRRRASLAEALSDVTGDPGPAVDLLTAFVAELCTEAPLVLVLDGLQWADEASVRFCRDLLPLSPRLLLVATARPVPRRPDVARLRRAVAESGGDVVGLDTLPATDAVALVTGLLGAPPGANLRRLVGHAGGNPRYTREVVDALLRDGLVEFRDGVAEIDGDTDRLPSSLVSALTRSLDFLSPETLGVLRWATLLGDEFSVEDAATAAGRPVSDLAAAVDEATAAGVLADSGSLLTFRHPLLRQALRQGMPAAVRTALHRQAAESLAGAGAAVEVVAGQLAAAPSIVDAWVVEWLVENAHAVAERAPDVAAGLLRTVVDQPSVDPGYRERLAARLAELLFRLGRRPDAEARYVLARTRDPELAAGMRRMLRYLDAETTRSVPDLRAAVADDAVPTVWRARSAALLAELLAGGDWTEAEESAWHALRQAEEVSDDFAAAHAWRVLWQASSARFDHEEALTRVDRALAVAQARADLRGWQATLSADKASTLRHLDRLADADAVLRAVGTASDALNVAMAVQNYWLGRWDDNTFDHPAHGLSALVAARRGRIEVAREHLHTAGRRAVTTVETSWFAPAAESFIAEAEGRVDQAIAALQPLLQAPRTPERHQWLPLLTRLALSAHRHDIAVHAARICAEDAAVEQIRAEASAAHCQGLIDGDPAPVLATAAHYRDVGRPVQAAEALETAAALLAARGDDARARTTSDEATAGYTRLGATLDVRRTEAQRHTTRNEGKTG